MTSAPNTGITEDSSSPPQPMSTRTNHERRWSTSSPPGAVKHPRIPRTGLGGAKGMPSTTRSGPPLPLERRRRDIPSKEKPTARSITTMGSNTPLDLERERVISPTTAAPSLGAHVTMTTRAPWQKIGSGTNANGCIEVTKDRGAGAEGADTPGYRRKDVDTDPDGAGAQPTDSEDIEKSERRGMTTRSFLKRREGMVVTAPTDVTLQTCLPHSAIPTRQRAIRKDARAGGMHTRKGREVENMVGTEGAPRGCDRGDGEREAKGSGGATERSGPCRGEDSGNDAVGGDVQPDAMGEAIKSKKKEGRTISDSGLDKKQISAATSAGKKRKQAMISNNQPATDKQLVSIGPVTRSRSRVQIPAKP